MPLKKTTSFVFITSLSVIILCSAIYFLSYQSSLVPKVGKTKDYVANQIISPKKAHYFINGNDYEVAVFTSTTVFSVLQDLSQKENFTITYKVYPEMGILVQGINGLINGTDDMYWQYWVNDSLEDVACDKRFLKAGDAVEWRFESVPAF